MPSACFDAIHNVSTPWIHAKGMSLRYGAFIFGDLTYPQFSIRRWRAKKASLHRGGVGWLELFRDNCYLCERAIIVPWCVRSR